MQSDFADDVGINEGNLCAFIKGRRSLTPRMAWAFAKELRTTPDFWMKLQSDFWLWESRPKRATRKASRKRRRR